MGEPDGTGTDGTVKKTVLVIGDLMVDEYVSGADEGFVEDHIPKIVAVRVKPCVGGAANVANILKDLGVDVKLAGIVGGDDAGDWLLNNVGVNTQFVYKHKSAPTTIKTRVYSEGKPRLRYDCDVHYVDCERQFKRNVLNAIETSPDMVLLSDYNKGALSPTILHEVKTTCHKRSIPVIGNIKPGNVQYTKNGGHLRLLSTNYKEFCELAGKKILGNSYDEIAVSMKDIVDRFALESLLVTLGDAGMCYMGVHGMFAAEAEKVEPVSTVGAGDAVIAAVAAYLCRTDPPENESVEYEMLRFANNIAAKYITTNRGAIVGLNIAPTEGNKWKTQ